MTAVTVFTVFTVPAYAGRKKDTMVSALTEPRTYCDKYHNGFKAPSLNGILSIFKYINTTSRILTGFPIFDEEKLTFTADGFVDEIIQELSETSFFNGYEIANGIPLAVKSSENIINLFRLDMETVVPELQHKVDEIYNSGDTFKFVAAELMLIYLRQLREVNVHEVKVSDTVYRVCADIVYTYGGTDHMDIDLYYNTETQTLYSSSGKGVFDLGFNFDRSSYTLTSVVNSWQRRFGFCLAYDFIANLVMMDYDTERVKFTYDNKEWMIQLWKGRYFIAPGAEIGVYNRDIGSFGSYYNCVSDDEMLEMSMELYHEDELLFSVGPETHWWLTGFNINDTFYLPESLTMNGSIVFPTDEMAELFTESAEKHRKLSVEKNGTVVSFTFS